MITAGVEQDVADGVRWVCSRLSLARSMLPTPAPGRPPSRRGGGAPALRRRTVESRPAASPLRLDDVEAQLTGEDELLVRWLNGGPGTREGVEAYFRHCRKQWDTAGPLRAFGIRVGADEVLAGTIDLRSAGEGLAPGQVNVAYGLYPSHLVMATLLALVWLFIPLPLSVTGLAAGFAWSVVTHAVLDRRWPVRWLLQHTGSPDFAELRTAGLNGMYLADHESIVEGQELLD